MLTPVHANQPITSALSKDILTSWSGDSDLKRKQQASEQAEDVAGASGMAGTLGSALHSTLQRNQHCLHSCCFACQLQHFGALPGVSTRTLNQLLMAEVKTLQ